MLLPVHGNIIDFPPTGTMLNCHGLGIANQRLPTDPLFLADVTLQNIIVGSRYWIAQASDLTNVLATGLAETTEVVVENVPAYTNPMLMEVRVRNGSGATKYKQYKTFAYLVREGVSVYISQVEYTVLND